MPTCERCGATITFARTEAGKLMPLDPEPADDGNMVALAYESGQEPRVRALRDGEDVDPIVRRMPHFATCSAGRP